MALIERARVPFGPGFNVLTGETGAGKSLVLDALGLAVGQRASAELVRAGEEAARVDAVFELPEGHPVASVLEGWGYEGDDGQWVLSRELSRSGRSRCRINGRPVTTAELARLGEALVSIHTQHESQKLLRASEQLDLLDGFAGEPALRVRRDLETVYRELERARRDLAHLADSERRRLHELDLLRFQMEEIAAASPRPGEDEELAAEHRRLANAARLRELLQQALERLAGGPGSRSALDELADGAARLEQAAALDPEVRPLAQQLARWLDEVQELARTVRRLAEQREPDPDRLQQVESRRDLLERLKRKYGPSLEAVRAYLEAARTRMAELEQAQVQAAELEAEVARLQGRYAELSEALRRIRADAAAALAAAVEAEAGALAMPGVRMVVQLEPAEPGPTGADRVEFLFSANPGEVARPLARVASGGELSRIMLACRTVLAGADPVPVLVFDEPDAGVGGQAARAVGERLARLGRGRQVLVVTHLPQVASLADHHLAVEKVEQSGRTLVRVEVVDGSRRVRELARMLGGGGVSATAERHAEELLRLAGEAKATG